jgi:hypothetical protein
LSGSHNLLWGGVITFLLTGLGAVTSFAFRNSAPTAVMLGGCLGLLGGAVVTVAAIVASTPALLLLGTVMAGLGFWAREPREAPPRTAEVGGSGSGAAGRGFILRA